MAQDTINTNIPLSREGGSKLLQRSCHDCSRRKVRCNKVFPCENCVRLGVECKFPPPGRKPRKTPKTSSNKAELVSRLRLLEQQVKKLGSKGIAEDAPERDNDDGSPVRSGLVKHCPGDGVNEQAREVGEDDLEANKATSSTLEDQFGRLVVDRNTGTSRYVNHRVLTDLAEQVYFTLP
jgi:hypothetical protein